MISAVENNADAKQFYENVVRAQPGNANAHFDLANVYLVEKRYEDALKHYQAAGRLGGLAAARMPNYYFNLSICYAGLGDMGEAVKSLERCIKVNPGNQEAKNLLEIYKARLSP
jgi:tetratricopeptide (TPR) repeat protein